MKFTVFLFLLCFMKTISFPDNDLTTEPTITVFYVSPINKVHIIQYKATSNLKRKYGYVFLYIHDDRYDIIYLIGDNLPKIAKSYLHAGVVNELLKAFENFSSLDIYVTEKPFDSTIKTFSDVISVNVTKKMPKLYDVIGAYNIQQVEVLSKAIKTMNSYVLYDGSTVTVYYSKPKNNDIQKLVDIKKKTAESLAKYFAKIENIENDSIVYLDGVEGSPEAAKKSFIKTIFQINPNATSKKQLKPDESSGSSDAGSFKSIKVSTLGPKECTFKEQTPEIYQLLSTCVYVIINHINEEIFMYIGKKTTITQLENAFNLSRILPNTEHMKVTFIIEGNPLPIDFMIHVECEIKNCLQSSSNKNKDFFNEK